jgi:hypothetical protein
VGGLLNRERQGFAHPLTQIPGINYLRLLNLRA